MRYPTDHFGLIRRDAALARDISDDHLVTAVRTGDLIRLAPGVFVAADDSFGTPSGADALYRLRSIATATSGLIGGLAMPLSHVSAAALHGLPLLKPDRSRVHVTTGRGGGGSVRVQRHIHGAVLAPDDITVIDDIPVTSLARTAVDVASMGDFAQALTTFDAALRSGADREEMDEILKTRRRKGIRAARRALPLASPLSESVGESWSRAQMIDANLPVPRLQRRYCCGTKEYYTDFDWDGLLIGEFDGLHKYGRLRRPGESVADAIIREKVREDDLRALGPLFLRWQWGTLERHELPGMLRPRLTRVGLIAA